MQSVAARCSNRSAPSPAEEHAAIIAGELNTEQRDFYELLWHTGAAQSDAACMLAEDSNWNARTISYSRKKLKGRGGIGIKPALIRFGVEVEAILKRPPQTGLLFPYLCTVRAGDRVTEFRQRCDGLEIKGGALHSYRYAWAERALKCGYPERFAQQALGHNSKAVHHAYSKHAEVTVPSLDDWEKEWERGAGQSAERRAQSGKDTVGGFMAPPKLLPVDFRATQVVLVVRNGESPMAAIPQSN